MSVLLVLPVTRRLKIVQTRKVPSPVPVKPVLAEVRVLISMSVILVTAIKTLCAIILKDHLNVHATLDFPEMASIVKISTNV